MGRVTRTLMHGWNVFKDTPEPGYAAGPSYTSFRHSSGPHYLNDKSIVGSIYTRLAVDFSQVEFYHARLNDDGVAVEIINDDLNDVLTLNPNIDQAAQAFKIDLAWSMFENGVAAVIPITSNLDPSKSASFKIEDIRVGKVVGWHPRRVTVEVYDDREVDDDGQPVNGGVTKQITLEKKFVPIMVNPFYDVMNAPNSTLQRLIRKLALLDSIDEAAGSGDLDLILQLPYATRSASRQDQAEKRRADLRNQLKNDELGIGYIDVTEKVIQLNRPVENKLLEQIQFLYAQVQTQLGITPEIMNGTASRDAINNYYDRTIEPIATVAQQEYKRKFLTKTARTQKQSVEVYRDPLKLIPIEQLAEVVDKLTRASAVTANEIRPKIGLRPSKDEIANQLRNPNLTLEDQGLGSAKEEVKNEQEPTE